jgi:hypothetical protein
MNKKLFKHLVSLLLGTILLQEGYAQGFEPIFEDAQGKTSIIAPKGYLGVNTANSSIRFEYFYSKSASPNPHNPTKVGRWNRFYCGANVVGSAEGGLATLFSNGNFNPGTSADLLLGHRSLLFGTVDRRDRSGEAVRYYFGDKKVTIQDWLTLRMGVKAAKYKLYDKTQPFNQQLSTEQFRGHVVQLAYTLLFNGATSIGASWDVSKINNINELTPTKFKQETTITDPSGQTTRKFEQEVNVYSGAYSTLTLNTYSLDLVQLLTSTSSTRYAFHLFGRLAQSSREGVYKAGLGFYAFPKGKIFGGVFVESNDVSNKVSNTPNFFKRVDIGLTVKFAFPSLGGLGE